MRRRMGRGQAHRRLEFLVRRRPGADGRALCAAIRARSKVNPVFIEDVENLGDDLRSILQDGDLVLTMGAGSIGRVAAQLKASLEAKAVTG